MNLHHAKLLAEQMPSEAVEVVRKFGRENMSDIERETIDYLISLRLIYQTENLLTQQMVWLLTDDGKKVQKAIGRGER